MSQQSTFVVPSSAEALIYGISHIELTARRVKIYKTWNGKPAVNVSRKGLAPNATVYGILEHAAKEQSK